MKKKLKVALIGGNEEGLLTLASLTQDVSTEVVMLVDQDQKALAFRLHEYGFTFEKIFTFSLTSDIQALRAISDLDLIVDASGDARMHQALYRLNHPSAKVMTSQAARVLWEIKSHPLHEGSPDSFNLEGNEQHFSKRQTVLLGKGATVLHSLVSQLPQEEVLRFILEGLQISLEADWSAVYLEQEERRRLVSVYSRFQVSSDTEHFDTCPPQGLSELMAAGMKVKRTGIFLTPPFQEFWTGRVMEVLKFHQYIAVPIYDKDRFVGFVELGKFEDKFPWVKRDAEFVEQTLSQNDFKPFLTALGDRENSLEPLLRSLKSIVEQPKSLQENLEAATSEIHQFVHSSALLLFVKDPESGDLVLQSQVSTPFKMNGMYRMKPEEGIGGMALQKGSSIYFKEEECISGRNIPMGIFYFPLIVQNQSVGLLILEFKELLRDPLSWKEEFNQVTELLAVSISSEVERRYMAQKVIKLTVVNEEGLELVSTTDRDKVLMMASASVAMIVEAEAVILRVKEKESSRLLVGYTYGLHNEPMDKFLIQLDGGIAARVSESKQVFSSASFQNGEFFKEKLPPKFPYHSVLSMPLFDQGELIGTISVYNKIIYNSFTTGSFNETDRELLEKYGSYIGKALVKAKEYQIREKLITIDELTGLKNERYLHLRLPEELKRAERYKRKLSLLFLDLDKNKKEFANLPQVIYDTIAQNMGKLIHESFRHVDIVARIKGTRFAVLLPDTGRKIGDTLSRLNDAISALRIFNQNNQRISLNLLTGYATYPEEALTGEELAKKASGLLPFGAN
ncbi:MAG: diguanylate cyclase [Nitrospirae bacterium]|nr:diguanylate cyclase [Nitrospirota bacterium]